MRDVSLHKPINEQLRTENSRRCVISKHGSKFRPVWQLCWVKAWQRNCAVVDSCIFITKHRVYHFIYVKMDCENCDSVGAQLTCYIKMHPFENRIKINEEMAVVFIQLIHLGPGLMHVQCQQQTINVNEFVLGLASCTLTDNECLFHCYAMVMHHFLPLKQRKTPNSKHLSKQWIQGCHLCNKYPQLEK